MNTRSLLILVVLLLASGCTQTERIYVTQRDVPSDPSFTVLPASNRLYQVQWANRIEQGLINLGVAVVDRPGAKSVRREKTATKSDVQGNQNQAMEREGEMKVVREYMVRDVESDYAVETYASSGQIRIMKVETEEVIAAFSIDPNIGTNPNEGRWDRIGDSSESDKPKSYNSIEHHLYDVLASSGIPVRKPNQE